MASRKKAATEGGETATAEQATGTAAPAKRGPGRPKGSTSKAAKAGASKRGPGRPKGSKNRAATAKKAGAARAGGRRGRRPAGGRNIGARLDAMIAELTALRAEVGRLEQIRTQLRDISQM
jgi:hypothetical protein